MWSLCQLWQVWSLCCFFHTLSDACAASTMRPSSLKEPCWSAGSRADLRRMFKQNIKKYDIAAGGGPCQQRWPVIQTSWEPRVSCADAGEWLSCPDEILHQYDLEKQQVSRSQRRNNHIYPTSYLGKSSQNSWTRNTRKCCVPLWESCWYCEYYSQYITLTKIMAFHEPVAENRWAQKIDHQRQLSI